MKETIGNFIFDSNFDNGNLHKAIEVEEFQPLVNDSKVMKKYEFQDIINSLKGMKIRSVQDYLDLTKKDIYSKAVIAKVKRYCLWTKPDAYDSVADTKNRTWFYFSIKECSPSISEFLCDLKQNEKKDNKKDNLLEVLNISTSSMNSNENTIQQNYIGKFINK